jgi:hypothetical protein
MGTSVEYVDFRVAWISRARYLELGAVEPNNPHQSTRELSQRHPHVLAS